MTATQAAIWTAVGTLALAVVTLAAIVTTIVITAQDRRRASGQLACERKEARDREQLTEASAVQVILGNMSAVGPMAGKGRVPDRIHIVAIVINHGHYTITRMAAQLYLGGPGNPSLVPFDQCERLTGMRALDSSVRADISEQLHGSAHTGRLTPWDLGLRFISDVLPGRDLPSAHAVVRWQDRWGTHWEHRRDEVRKVQEGEPWNP